jgi:Na+/melibiose symporter-like transporter
MKDEKLKTSTVWSYAFAQGSGYQIMGAVVGSYLMIFLTDTFKVPVAAVGIIMVLASIWDAINDPMMGVLADRTKSRWGRYRPYLLFVPLPLSIVTVLLFASPNISDTGKIIWTAVFYVGFGMLRTAMEIPCGALINAVTDRADQRNRMISAYTFTMGIFTTLATSFALVAVSFFGGQNTAKGYMIVMALAGALMTVSCWICFARTSEKYVMQKKSEKPVREEIRELFSVKGLIPVIVTWLAAFIAYNCMMSSSVYYMMYYICRPDLISFYMLDISLVGLLGIAVGLPGDHEIVQRRQKGLFRIADRCSPLQRTDLFCRKKSSASVRCFRCSLFLCDDVDGFQFYADDGND